MITLKTVFQYSKEKPSVVEKTFNSIHMVTEEIRRTLTDIHSSPTKPVTTTFKVILSDEVAHGFRPDLRREEVEKTIRTAFNNR